jgi:NAD(P)-dependent dehydrogenase (short-subunit alcohol dehydrogenase family)
VPRLWGATPAVNYGAAKQGIAGFTFIAALELQRYGMTAEVSS